MKGHQIFLSRAHPQFIAKLFFQEVPEIYEGTIEIKSVARDPGSRAKICVHSKDSSIDPVGACVGMRGSRVQTIVNELHGEKIDIIKWTEDLPTLISESLSPAEIQRVLIDQDNKRIDIILTEENLSKAIGRRGQNVRLASKLTNYEIDILTDKEDSERRQAEFKERTETLIKNLEVDETLGQLLISEGFVSIDEISQSKPEDISKIDAIDEETAKELISRSKETLIKEKEAVSLKLKELGVDRRMNSGVSKFHVLGDQITEIELESGEYVIADQIISTCGVIETESLLSSAYQTESQSKTGDFTIIESISVMQGKPKDLNWEETVVFFNDSAKFDYICPKDPVDLRSGVICIPENYNSANDRSDFKLRITHPANFSYWSSLSKEEYMNEKEKYENLIFLNGLRYLNNEQENKEEMANRILLRDTFTPKTIKRFTNHENGALYGSPTKSRNGSTKLKNLFLAGTDQGYIGIVGAMLGGIAVANNQILRPA